MTTRPAHTPAAGRGPTGGSAATTRRQLLDAARAVFSEAGGFADAGIADVVARAGASVGSLYHHFGGKSDLYVALYEEFQTALEDRATEAVRQARAAGERDPVRLFVTGTRAYLLACWEERDLARLFLAPGGPPGFGVTVRKRYREWLRRNELLLRSWRDDGLAEDEPTAEALVLVLTTVAAAAGGEVAVAEDASAARRLAEDVCTLVARIGGSG